MYDKYNKAIIENKNERYIAISIYKVYRGNFNDSYLLESYKINLNTMNNIINWFDPFMGFSKIKNIETAIVYCNDTEIIILEKNNENIKEFKKEILMEHIICEDYDESYMLASHIWLSI